MRAFYLVVILIVISFFPVKGNTFRYLQPDKGLSSGEINDIVQDNEGRIWLATWTGLVCYNGYEFVNFRPILGDRNSLPDKKIKKLFIDSSGQLWIVTEKNLARMSMKTFQFETFSFDRKSSRPINIIQIAELSESLIVHTVEGFFQIPVDVKNTSQQKLRKINLYNDNQLIAPYFHFTKSCPNNILVGASNTGSQRTSIIYFMEIKYRSTDTVLIANEIKSLNGDVYQIENSANGSAIYFASNYGVYVYQNHSFLSNRIFDGINTQQLIITSSEKIFAADDRPGLYVYDLISQRQDRYLANPNEAGSILNSNILSLFEDFSGNLWIGHQGQGISILDLTRKEFLTIRRDPNSPNSLTSNTVMCFESNNRYLLVGCRTGGINIAALDEFDSGKVNFDVIPFNTNTTRAGSYDGIWDIARQSDSVFWIGHSDGIFRLSFKKGSRELTPFRLNPEINDFIRSIYIDKNRNLWCGTLKNGLLFVPDPNHNPDHTYFKFLTSDDDSTSISDNVVLDLFLDSKNRFWVGTDNGLNLLQGNFDNLDLSGNTKPDVHFRRFVGLKQTSDFLNNNEINCIFENSDGKIWVATQGGGINVLDPETFKFSHLTMEEGLPGNDIFGILPDNDKNLWIATEKGLAEYNQDASDSKITTYRSSDGIQSNVFLINSYHKSSDGRLFFGGENGFTTFYPDKIVPNAIPPKTVFTDLKILNKTVNVGDTIYKEEILKTTLNEATHLILPFNNNTFSIGVAAIHYQNPEGNKIAYMLEGYQQYWQEISATKRSLIFTKIPAGNYTLKVYSISSDNFPEARIKTLDITILPPWYLMKIMIVLYLIFSLTLITFIVVILINRQKQLFLKRLYDINIENNESKMMYLANIAHELRTPLSLIISPIEDMIINKNEVRKRWHNHIQLIHRNSNYILKLINQIIDFRKLDVGKLKLVKHNHDLVRLVNDVAFNFKSFETRQNVNLILDLPSEPLIVNIDEQKIEEVLYNLLSNAFKNTANGHSIELSVGKKPNRILQTDSENEFIFISVFNEGKEIPEREREKIFERFYKTEESADGAGIGLSFAKSLVEMHNGKIWFENNESEGVTFWVALPFIVANTLEEDVRNDEFLSIENITSTVVSKLNSWEESEEEKEKKTKILIVEDNTDLREYLVDLLSRTYQCYEAADGEKGLKMTMSIIPDVLITDVIMPNLDGYGLVQKIKDDIKTCHIPVIMLTAKHASDNIIMGYESGVDAYVSKPFDTNVLLSQISRLIKNRELIHQKYKQQNFMVEVTTHNLSRDDIFLNNVKKLLEKNIANPEFNVSELSDEMQMSSTQLYRKIKSLTNYSPVEFMRITRLHRAHDLLAQKNYSIKEVCYQTGFNNFSYFVKCFREYFGVTPASYRDNGDK